MPSSDERFCFTLLFETFNRLTLLSEFVSGSGEKVKGKELFERKMVLGGLVYF